MTDKDKCSLGVLVMNSRKIIENAEEVLFDYYSVVVDPETLMSVLIDNPEFIGECLDNGIRDTCQRDMFMDAILKQVGINMAWPCYGDTEEYRKTFHDALATAKCVKYKGE